MGASILVVEDNGPSLDLMCYLLAAFGHAPTAARDGDEGWRRARAGGFDLIACDVHLPKRNGVELARSLKGDPVLRRVPLVAVTSMAMPGDREKLLAAGF